MKRIDLFLTMLTLLISTGQAVAQDKQTRIFIDDMTFTPGEELEVKVKFEGNISITQAQFYLDIPTGFEFVNKGTESKPKYAQKTTATEDMQIATNLMNANHQLRVVVSDANQYGTEGTSGELAIIYVKTSEGLTAGLYKFNLNTVVASDAYAGRYPTADTDINVIFSKDCNVSIVSENEAKGTVSVSPELIGTVPTGTQLTLTATANENYVFIKWSDGTNDLSTESTFIYTVTDNVTITAYFSEIIEDANENRYVKDGNGGIKLITIVDNDGTINIPATVSYKGETLSVTGIDEAAFDGVNKSSVKEIDLSKTSISGLTVNRKSGIFNGIDEATLILLPAGNHAAEGEKNVVIGGVCEVLEITEDKPFSTSVAFQVKHAVFDRTFQSDVTATVYLPFSIPAANASVLGTFHTFKQIDTDGNAVFNTAETGDIQPNTPYIFVPKSTISAIDITDEAGNISVPITGSSVGTNGYLIGTTTTIVWDGTNTPENIYGFAAEERDNISIGAFVKAGVGASITPYRAYLLIDDTAAARSLYRVIVDETTGINHIKYGLASDKEKWYHINGIQLESTPTSRGLYIKNGNKIIIK